MRPAVQQDTGRLHALTDTQGHGTRVQASSFAGTAVPPVMASTEPKKPMKQSGDRHLFWGCAVGMRCDTVLSSVNSAHLPQQGQTPSHR